jgi:hypothetical protein
MKFILSTMTVGRMTLSARTTRSMMLSRMILNKMTLGRVALIRMTLNRMTQSNVILLIEIQLNVNLQNVVTPQGRIKLFVQYLTVYHLNILVKV